MKMDKNTVIGLVLLAVLFFAFFWYTNKQQQTVLTQKKHEQDSIAMVEAAKRKMIDTAAALKDSIVNDSISKTAAAGGFQAAARGTEQLVTVENDVFKATFTNKGGQLKNVELKNYISSYNKKNVVLNGSADDAIGYTINTSNNSSASTADLYFTASPVVKNADGSQTVSFNINSPDGRSITHQYVVKKDSYAIDWNVGLTGANQLLTRGLFTVKWQMHPQQHEKNVTYERQQSNICFSEGNDFDYISSKTERKFEKPVQWVGVIQQFFNTTLIAKNGFNKGGDLRWARKQDSSTTISDVDATLQAELPAAAQQSIAMQLYVGPNEYKILHQQAEGMDKIVNLGRDMYSFVRPINKYIIMPVFNLFSSLVKNYGWAILLLTLFIRLVTSPLTYSSYLSGAKMKVLKPEMEALKKKHGDDQQAYAMDQMKLFREAGVNPLGGCIPALLQIPIFFALYSFFNSNIELRGQSFLWSHDLSAYDTIVNFPFEVWGLGNHLSLFTITAVLTSFLISIYNMAMTPTQDNPAMKYMPYIFPFILFFVFNKLPSALTWYYTVSNLITLGLQFVIQNYIINHDKILAKIEEKRKAPKTKSKWAERMEQMQETQKKMQDAKQRKK